MADSKDNPARSAPPTGPATRPKPSGEPAKPPNATGKPPNGPVRLNWPGVPTELRPELIPAGLLDQARKVAKARQWPLYLWGQPGTGKTCAAAWLASRFGAQMDRPPNILFRSFLRICQLAGDCRRRGQAEEDWSGTWITWTRGSLWQRIRAADLLVLDDIGPVEDAGLRREVMHEVLDLRLGRPTLLTGNVLPEDLSALFDDRVASRLTAGHMLEVAGVDRRALGFEQRMTVVGG